MSQREEKTRNRVWLVQDMRRGLNPLRSTFSREEKETLQSDINQLRGSGRLAQPEHRQRQVVRGPRLRQQFTGHFQTRTATGATTGAHGQFRHRAAAIVGRFANLVIGDSIADADVHGGHRGRQARSGLPSFQRKREWLSIKFLNHSRYPSACRPLALHFLRPVSPRPGTGRHDAWL